MRKLHGRGCAQPPACETPGSGLPHLSYRPTGRLSRPRGVNLILDGLSIVLATMGLIMMLSARADSRRWPLLGLVVPTLLFLLSDTHRQRLADALRANARAARAFSEGAGGVPWKAAAVLVVLPAFLFVLSNGSILGAIDTLPVIPTAVSLVREGNWDVSEFDRAGPRSLIRNRDGQVLLCYQARGDRIHSAFPSGMVLFAAPVAGLARLCGADLDQHMVHLRLEKITAALVASLCLGLFFLTACCLGSAQASAVATLLLAVSSGIYTTVGLGLWQHGGIVFWTLVALLVEFASAGSPSRMGSVIQGIACGALLMCRPTAALGVAGLGTWIFIRSRRRALLTMAVAAAAYLPCIALYESLYGNVFGPSTINQNMTGSLWQFGRVETIAGVLWCPARGLFVYQPWAILSILALVPGVRSLARQSGRRAQPAGWLGYCLTVATAHCFLISAWHDWSGGYCWGSRLLTDIVPLLGLLSVPAIEALCQTPRTRTVIVALAVTGALTHLPCTYLNAASWNYVTDHKGDLWSWSHAPFFHIGSH